MENQFEHKGFDPAKKDQEYLNLKVFQLKQLTPVDAVVTVDVNKFENVYFMSILVCHQNGNFAARAKAKKLSKLANSCFDKIHEELRDWKLHRSFREVGFN